ncbi:MAG: DUF2889 domain-containing protein [Thiolinea sp.]
MPLSSPAARQLAHTRVVTCQGYEREDGLWDIEGHIVDTKPYSFPNKDRGGILAAGDPLHSMRIRLTIDLDMLIHDAEQCTDASPYNYCHEVEHFCKKLIGERIGPGWTRKVKTLMGAGKGCTHITELLGPVATTAFQTLVKARINQEKTAEKENSGEEEKRPQLLDTCHALQASSPVVKEHWPRFHEKKTSGND